MLLREMTEHTRTKIDKNGIAVEKRWWNYSFLDQMSGDTYRVKAFRPMEISVGDDVTLSEIEEAKNAE